MVELGVQGRSRHTGAPSPRPPGACALLLACACARPRAGHASMGRVPPGPSGDRLGPLLQGKCTVATVFSPGGFCSRPAAMGPGWRQTLPRNPQTPSGSGVPEPPLCPVLLPFLVPRRGWGGPCGAASEGRRDPLGRGPGEALPSLRAHSAAGLCPSLGGGRSEGATSPPRAPHPHKQICTQAHAREDTCEHTRMHTALREEM